MMIVNVLNYNNYNQLKSIIRMFCVNQLHSRKYKSKDAQQLGKQGHQMSSYQYEQGMQSKQSQQIYSDYSHDIRKRKLSQQSSNRVQSYQIYVPKWNFRQVGQLKVFNKQMLQGDFSFLYSFWPNHSQQFINNIYNITSNWNMYQISYQKALQQFLHIFKVKVQNMPLFEQIYPGVTRMIKMIEKVEEMQGSVQKIGTVEDQKTDILYQHYLLALESKKTRKGAYYIKDESTSVKKPIGEFIADTAQFNQGKGWQDIFFKATAVKQSSLSIGQTQKQNRTQFLKALDEGKPVMFSTRLCCCTFFYYYVDVSDKSSKEQANIITNRTSKSLIDEKGLTSIMMDICALLNSGGGMILFDTFRDNLQIMPCGQKILTRQFKNYKQKIQSRLQKISPAIKTVDNVRISLVPVVKNPYTDGLGKEKQYLAGTFVLRIVIIPSQAQKMYYYNMDEQEFKMVVVENNCRINLNGRQGVRRMKKKWIYFYVPECDYQNEEQKQFLSKPFKYIDHQCVTPQRGFPVSDNTGNVTKTAEQLQKDYKYLSLLVASKQNHQKIHDQLRYANIQCYILVKYEKYKFKAASNSAILFHDCKFEDLLKATVNKPQFAFERPIMTICVTQYLKLVDRTQYNIMPEDDFESLRKWMDQEHKNQIMEMWRFEAEDKKVEFYLKTGNKISTIFMYYVLNHYAEKAIFKNPKDLEKLMKDKWSQQEKKEKFKKYYPRQK